MDEKSPLSVRLAYAALAVGVFFLFLSLFWTSIAPSGSWSEQQADELAQSSVALHAVAHKEDDHANDKTDQVSDTHQSAENEKIVNKSDSKETDEPTAGKIQDSGREEWRQARARYQANDDALRNSQIQGRVIALWLRMTGASLVVIGAVGYYYKKYFA